ncbi:hypothetical protein CDD81_1252 [Ophiocordyceps australis]|uniref:Uncharacterized protein n=1 Tax=Ophiocordyceps australis TaxID=1399860 RepID=A0A2C5YE56_9HYPO|nr:hypothetical protein CDD81_1252 [Ophiocordyceps australis]
MTKKKGQRPWQSFRLDNAAAVIGAEQASLEPLSRGAKWTDDDKAWRGTASAFGTTAKTTLTVSKASRFGLEARSHVSVPDMESDVHVWTGECIMASLSSGLQSIGAAMTGAPSATATSRAYPDEPRDCQRKHELQI